MIPDPNEKVSEGNFGKRVAISHNAVVVSDFERNSVYIFLDVASSSRDSKDPASLYSPSADILLALVDSGSTYFGFSIAIDEGTLVVGAPMSKDETGEVYIFYGCTSKDSETCIFDKANKIVPTGLEGIGLFGRSVSVSKGTVVVGNACGKAVVVLYGCTSLESTSCINEYRIEISAPASSPVIGFVFGYNVAVFNKTIVVGEPPATGSSVQAGGTAYIYYNCLINSCRVAGILRTRLHTRNKTSTRMNYHT